mgnify:CR=1 FL=1
MSAPANPSYRIATPRASVLIGALRGLGYSTAAALADIIDNSIAADAGAIDIDFLWNGIASHVTIRDDGSGMFEHEIEKAMRLGDRDPREERRPEDLGRFGLGLKTASFSQCKRLTVISKRDGAVNAFRWDLDILRESRSDEWRLLVGTDPSSESLMDLLDSMETGTLVAWEVMDRIILSGFTAQDFLDLIDEVERHLSLVFHRYLSKERIVIRLNGRKIAPIDPFLTDHPATWASPPVPIRTPSGKVVALGFVLPHRDLIEEKDRQAAGGTHGWIAHQGFYVYRNERLLVAGSWLGLGPGRPWPKDEPHRLARIQLDISNSSDDEWKIDVRKSTARPPPAARVQLIRLAEDVRERARRVFAHRGKASVVGSSIPVTQVWVTDRLAKGLRYRIDETHPVVAAALEDAGGNQAQIRAMLRTIEETIPVQRIWLDTAEGKETPQTGFVGQPDENLTSVLRVMFSNLVKRHGMSAELARERLLHTEPFQNYPGLVASVSDEMDEGTSQ